MNRLRRLAAAAAFLAASGCGSAGADIRCDADGLIVMPKDASHDRWMDLFGRNQELIRKRTESLSGDGRGAWHTPATLEKARGCP